MLIGYTRRHKIGHKTDIPRSLSMTITKTTTTLILLILTLIIMPAWAENSTSIPGYTIHHNALTTDNLQPQVASAYGIQRSKERAMINISVIKDVPGTMGKAVTAKVKVTALNLIGQRRDIPMREIREGDAIYYIGDFRVAHRERMTFLMDVTPDGSGKTFETKLEHEFYTD